MKILTQARLRELLVAQIAIGGGKVINLGGYPDIDDAKAARKRAEEIYFGEFKCRAS